MSEFNVSGMTCQHCIQAVTEAILEIDASAAVTVDLAGGRVSVESAQPMAAVRAAIQDAGYTIAAG
jgi:copper chaperone